MLFGDEEEEKESIFWVNISVFVHCWKTILCVCVCGEKVEMHFDCLRYGNKLNEKQRKKISFTKI